MPGIREPLEIIDRASAPLNRMAGAFAGAANAAQRMDTAASGSQAGINSLAASLSGISGTLTGGFNQVVTVLTDISTKITGISTDMTSMSGAAGAGLNQTAQSAQTAARGLQAVQYSATTAVGAFNAASQGATAMGSSLRLTSQSAENFRRVLDQSTEGLSSSFQRLIDISNQLGDRIDQMGRQSSESTDRAASSANGLASALRGAVAAIGGFAAIKGMISLSDEMSMMETRLNNVNDGLQTTAELYGQIFDAAQRSRGDFMGMVQTVASLKAQTGDTFSSVREAVAFTELLQKQFKLAGTNATGIQATMYNLTQALSTGVLRGQDLNTIFANAPQIVQRIADYMDVPIGQIKDMASEGKITADIVKNAMLSAAEDINEEFGNLPMTFGDAMQKVKNVAILAFKPIGQMIANAVNSPEFDAAATAIGSGLLTIANIAGAAFSTLGGIIKTAAENMNTLAPIIMGVVGAIAAYNIILGIATGIQTLHGIATTIMATAQAIYTAATGAATAGQSAFNAALAACPITWIVMGIVLIITAVIALIMLFHNMAATGHTVFGDIAGVAVGCFNVIVNALKIVGNFFITIAEGIVNGWGQMVYNIQTAIVNFAQGAIRAFASVVRGAENAANAIATAFVNGANAAIGGINALINAINAIPGVNIGNVDTISAPEANHGLSDAIEGIAAGLDNLRPEAVDQVSFDRFDVESFGDAFNSGFDAGSSWGDGVSNSIGDFFSGFSGDASSLMGDGTSMGDLLQGMDNLGDAMGGNGTGGNGTGGTGGKGNVGTVDKVKKVEDVKLSDEDMKIYKDLAEQRYLNRIELQTLAPNITVTIPEGAAKNMQAQDVANLLKTMLIEQQAAHGAMAHA